MDEEEYKDGVEIPDSFDRPQKPGVDDPFWRVIIHIDMDAYYAQVESRKHGIPEWIPMCVIQWKSIIALNY